VSSDRRKLELKKGKLSTVSEQIDLDTLEMTFDRCVCGGGGGQLGMFCARAHDSICVFANNVS